MSAAHQLRRAVVQLHHPIAADLIAVSTSLSELAQNQCGVVTRAQLGACGLTESQIAAAVDARRWRAYGRRVVVLDNAPLTDAQRLWVAALLPGKPSALAGLSAAASAGLRGFEPERVHIVVRHATHVRAPAWIKLHESRRFRPDDIISSSGPPRTGTARGVVDAAAWSQWPRRAGSILCASVQQRLVTVDQLGAELATVGSVRHIALLRQLLGDIAGGGHTLAEIDLGALARRAGLPRPDRQKPRPEPSGKVRWLDAEFTLPDGTVLVVEVDGKGHLDVETWYDDLSRQNEVVIGGRIVLRFPSLAIRTGEDLVVDQLRRARLAHTPR